MAELLNKIPTNLTEYPNSFKRQGAFPLEAYEVQYSLSAAQAYATSDPLAYVGQTIAVVENGDVTLYIISDAEGTLKEVGSATNGDGKTITLKDGVLSLYGLDGKTEGTFVPSLVNGVLTWSKPDTSTAEGQQQAIDALEVRADALELTVNGKPASGEEGAEDYVPAIPGLVDKVAALEAVDNATQAELDAYKEVVTTAISEALQAAKDYADANDADTIYDDSDLQKRVKALEDEERYDDTELSNRVTTLEGVVGDAENGLVKDVATNTKAISDMDAAYKQADTDNLTAAKTYTDEEIAGLTVSIEQKEGVEYIIIKDKAGTEITSANASKFVQDSFLDDVSYDPETGKVTFTWIMGDSSTKTDEIDIGDLVDTYTAGNGLTVSGNEFSIDTTVVATVEALNAVSEVAEAAQTAEEVASAIDAKITEANLGQYAKASDVEASLAGKVNVDDYNTDKATFALKSDVETTFGDYYTKTEIDGKGYAVAADVATTYATKDNLDKAVEDIEKDLTAYAKTADVNANLDKKIETAQITHTTTGTTEGVTKEGTALKIVVDSYTKAEVYTKSETDAAITAKINSVTGGESAADVKLALEDYRDAVNTEIWGADAASWTTKTVVDGKTVVTYTPQYGTTSRVDTLESDVATLKTNVQKAQDDATAAGTAVATLESGKVATNAANIATIQGQITGEGGLSARIGAIEAANTAHATEYANLKAKVDTAVDTTVPALTNRVAANEADLVTIKNTLNGVEGTEGLIATVAKKANAADVYTKGEVDGFVGTINTEIGKKADATSVYTKGEVDLLVEAAISSIDDTAIVNNAADIAVLVGTDKDENGRANKSIRAIAADEINTLIKAADPEGGKTIENINNLIAYVDENAGEIAELVTATEANTAKLADITGTVGATIDAKIEAAKYTLEVATAEKLGGIKSATDIVTGEGDEAVTTVAENKVYVDTTGVAEVKAVNVKTLVQDEDDVLILNGGTATI